VPWQHHDLAGDVETLVGRDGWNAPISTQAINLAHVHVVRGGHQVLDDISLTVAAGSVTGLLGPSGCGKTTLMRTIVGVQILATGRVTVLGRDAGTASLRRRVGYVTQARLHAPARDYLARRRAEGKTWREALRCLKRHLVRAVFKLLKEISLRSRLDQPVTSNRPLSAMALT
jgi:ABC-type Mn2+/Zn2+ transport system ATPase subunit